MSVNQTAIIINQVRNELQNFMNEMKSEFQDLRYEMNKGFDSLDHGVTLIERHLDLLLDHY
jgi:hypothetical protein